MQLARPGKRILAFIIDVLILSIVITLVETLLQDKAYMEAYNAIENAFLNGTISADSYINQMNELVDPNLGLKTLFNFILTVLYLVVLPLFLKGQTLGRMAAKIKVVKEDGTKVGAKDLIKREIIGQDLISTLIIAIGGMTHVTIISSIGSVCSLIVGVILIVGFFKMLGQAGITLYDQFSGTRMILTHSLVNVEDELDKDIIDL